MFRDIVCPRHKGPIMARCYCYVPKCEFLTCGTGCERVPCNEPPIEGQDFCKFHMITYNIRNANIRVTDDSVAYVAPVSGRVIMDDTWFRKNERYFRGYESKLMPGNSYTWIFVYHMVKRIEKRLKRFENYIPATKLQRAWRRCVSDPNYKMCRNRLAKEYSEF